MCYFVSTRLQLCTPRHFFSFSDSLDGSSVSPLSELILHSVKEEVEGVSCLWDATDKQQVDLPTEHL